MRKGHNLDKFRVSMSRAIKRTFVLWACHWFIEKLKRKNYQLREASYSKSSHLLRLKDRRNLKRLKVAVRDAKFIDIYLLPSTLIHFI